jgi:hypothetical protein
LTATADALTERLDGYAQTVTLVTLSLPRESGLADAGDMAAVLVVCRSMLSDDGCVAVTIRATDRTQYDEQERRLRAAAELADFVNVLKIVAVGSPGQGDEYVYFATVQEAALAFERAVTGGGSSPVEVLVFMRGSR